ncbi:MAG: RNA 2',3'-cyclic phosphodiesterase, partial [Thermodesulfobacteriota bacterium]
MRLFLAALLPEEVKARIDCYIRLVRPRCEGVKWENYDKLHVTLKFLGNVDDSMAARVSSAIGSVVHDYSPFETGVANLGGFPSLDNPRILIIALSENPGLSSLQDRVEGVLEPLGFLREKRKFFPHVTIGRIKSRIKIKEPLPMLERGEFTID